MELRDSRRINHQPISKNRKCTESTRRYKEKIYKSAEVNFGVRLAYRIKQEGIFFYNLRLIQLNIFAKKAFISPFVCCCCCFSLLSFFFGIMLFCVFICFIGIVTIIVCIFVQVFFFFWTAFSLFLLFLGLFCTLSFFFLLDCDSFSCSLFSFFFA